MHVFSFKKWNCNCTYISFQQKKLNSLWNNFWHQYIALEYLTHNTFGDNVILYILTVTMDTFCKLYSNKMEGSCCCSQQPTFLLNNLICLYANYVNEINGPTLPALTLQFWGLRSEEHNIDGICRLHHVVYLFEQV